MRESKLYLENIKETSETNIDWNMLKDKTILFTGITGLIGTFFADVIMYKNIHENLNCTIIGVGKEEKSAGRFSQEYLEHKNFEYIACDISMPFNYPGNIDFIVHAASNTHPKAYAEYPIETIMTNVFGVKNLLDLAVEKHTKKFVFISSFEVYGKLENKNEIFENDFGAIDCTVLRNCYPESKRLSESLCISYSEEKQVDVSIARLSRVFGPTMNYESSLATAQFIKSGINNQDTILKSDGTQKYSYNYVADAVTAILTILLKGKDKEAYNVSDGKFDLQLKDFAKIVADYVGSKVVFDLPDDIEKKGFSNTTMTILNSDKLKSIGWKVDKDIKTRIQETIDIIKSNK